MVDPEGHANLAIGGRSAPEASGQGPGDSTSIEIHLQTSVDRFQAISSLDESWSADIARGCLVHDPGKEAEITTLDRDWLLDAEDLSLQLARHERVGRSFLLAGSFREILQDARGIVTPDDGFFGGPAFEILRDHAIAEHQAGETVEFLEMGE